MYNDRSGCTFQPFLLSRVSGLSLYPGVHIFFPLASTKAKYSTGHECVLLWGRGGSKSVDITGYVIHGYLRKVTN